MEKEDMMKVLEACVLILDEVPEEEIKNKLDKPSFVKAQYLMNYLKSYKY